jgi:fibronectin type 3 domain-containing protein
MPVNRSAIRMGAILAALSFGLVGPAVFRLAAKPKPHSVALSWKAPPPIPGFTVAGYNVYRSTTSRGPYVKIAARVPDLTYTDKFVVSGRTYFYVVTAVDQADHESKYSEEIKAVIP